MALGTALAKARETAKQLQASGSGNEANTKALVIEPLLGALGWDLGRLEEVDREYRVYDGTFLDYALKIGDEPRLFVEAKGVSQKLEGKGFIAQAVNYANNEGVPWCVLTNGLAYRVYKTNEPVAMEDKLLFEVDLDEEEEGAAPSAEELELISRSAVEEGRLDVWGEQVFIDSRVRHAVAQLAADAPKELLARIEKVLGQPQVPPDRLRESLARILGAEAPAKPPRGTTKSAPRKEAAPKDKKDYTLDHHTAGKPAGMVDLFEQLDSFGQALGGDVTRRLRKFYVGYYAGSKERSFFTLEIQRQKVYVYLGLDPTEVQAWNGEAMRDVREIGHYGMGDTEYVLRKPEQLDEVKVLIRRAYDRVSAGPG